MRALLLCCLVALAVCQQDFGLTLNPNKIYEYQYEGMVKFGLGKPNRAESGARMKSLVKIMARSDSSENTYLLQVSNVVFEEFNGYSRNDYVAIEELTEKIKNQLSKPIAFTYSSGNVGNIEASPEISDTVVNLIRGILSFFQVTIKTTQEIYELEEVGIHGKCPSSYTIKTNDRERVMELTQVVDVTNCREKAAFYTGLANAVEDKSARRRGENLVSTVKYTYSIRASGMGGVITKAQARELQYTTPFSVKRGTFRMVAEKELVLISEKDKPENLHVQVQGPMACRGSLEYKVVKNNAYIPIVMQKLDEPKQKATQLIKRLAQKNAQQIDSTTTHEAIKLYQLLRVTPLKELMEMWGDLKGQLDERRWFLHTVVEVNDERILHFLEHYLSETELSTIEAVTVIVQAFNHLEASVELVKEAEKFLVREYRDSMIRKTVVLSYGSLVFKHCSYHTPCPESAIRPLVEMAEVLHSNTNEQEKEKILVLKALGNAGHPLSLKAITKFLPGVNPNPDQIDKRPRVVSAAVQALRLIAHKDPHNVQMVTLKLFLNRELESELRMLALMIMFDARPSMALVSTVTAHLLEERNMQVVNFAYTYLKRLARATTPDKHFVSIAASVAVKILAPRFGHLDYHTSRAMRMDVFSGDYLIGAAVEAFILKRASQLIPAEMMVKSNFHFIGRILQLFEFGVRPEGIRDLFGANIPGLRGEMSMSDFQAVYEVLKRWETLPEDKPVFSFYTRVSGQEFFFKDFSKNILKNLMRELSQTIGKDNYLWTLIEKLIQGFSWRGILPFLTAEARYIQATTVGLPMEISKYYHVVSGLRIDGKAGLNSNTNEHLRELLKSEVSLKTNGYIGYTKNMWLFYGVNTDLFQSAVEIKAINPVAIPFNLNAKINYNAKKFELEMIRSNREIELFSFRSDAFAISRNIIHPEAAKEKPIIVDSNNQQYSHVMLRDQPNRWDQVQKNCHTSTVYGLKLCTEMDLKREYFQDEYPLYYFLGRSHFAVKLEPVQSSSVEKIRLEINVDPSSPSVNVRQLIEALRQTAQEISQSSRSSASQEHQDRPTRGIGGSPVPKLHIKVVGESSSRQQGYDTLVFYTPEGQSYSVQMITSYIGEANSNWKMCVDAAQYGEAKVHIGFGVDCKTYTMSMRAALVATNRPGLKAYFSWRQIPEYMEQYGKRIFSYIPGMAFFMGFNQRHETNARQEVSASIIAASADSIDVKIKFPQLTVYRDALTSPMPPAYFLSSNSTINSNTLG